MAQQARQLRMQLRAALTLGSLKAPAARLCSAVGSSHEISHKFIDTVRQRELSCAEHDGDAAPAVPAGAGAAAVRSLPGSSERHAVSLSKRSLPPCKSPALLCRW